MGGVVVPPIFHSFFKSVFLMIFVLFFADEDEKAPQKKKADVRHINAHQEINFGSFVFGVSLTALLFISAGAKQQRHRPLYRLNGTTF